MTTVGIFGDRPWASTGFAVVLNNLANELSRYFRVIYFGRFGQEKEFAKETQIVTDGLFEYVPCQGGVWDEQLVNRILEHYKEIDFVFSEDDWFSAQGIFNACNFWKKPFHFHTPIDSLPISDLAWNNLFTFCDKIYIPNSSYKLFDGKPREKYVRREIRERAGDNLKAIYLPHGVDTNAFRPMRVERNDKFTFSWSGRIEQRKAPGRAILAFSKICNKMDARLIIRSDWSTPQADRFLSYILHKNLPVDLEQMAVGKDTPHSDMALIYNKADVNVCTSMAGGFEMNITENAACCIPSLVTDWTFMNENIVNGKSGFLIPVSGYTNPIMGEHATKARERIWGEISIDDLADAMYYCYNNQKEVKSMGIWARDWVKQQYNWKDIGYRLKEEILHV